jgi:hypothetical protein
LCTTVFQKLAFSCRIRELAPANIRHLQFLAAGDFALCDPGKQGISFLLEVGKA